MLGKWFFDAFGFFSLVVFKLTMVAFCKWRPPPWCSCKWRPPWCSVIVLKSSKPGVHRHTQVSIHSRLSIIAGWCCLAAVSQFLHQMKTTLHSTSKGAQLHDIRTLPSRCEAFLLLGSWTCHLGKESPSIHISKLLWWKPPATQNVFPMLPVQFLSKSIKTIPHRNHGRPRSKKAFWGAQNPGKLWHPT